MIDKEIQKLLDETHKAYEDFEEQLVGQSPVIRDRFHTVYEKFLKFEENLKKKMEECV